MDIGNYRIIKQIGEGGFGRIYQAEHALLGEKACIKQNIEASAEHAALLKREAKLLWTLNEHHSIPSTKDFFELGPNDCALAMDYIEGPTLDRLVKQNGRMHAEDACWITERLLGALYYCHYNGVIHSDVKPENIFVEEKKHDIKLIDFGLAVCKPLADTSPVGRTDLYAAPELFQGRPPIPETDIYGAGIVMLYALGGNIRNKAFPKDTPEAIKEFCSRLIQYDPVRRPNWEKENIIATLSDARLAAFGRRHHSEGFA